MLGLIWAIAWGPIAIVVGVTVIDPDNSMDEMWFAIGAYPGFLCGIVFRALLGIAKASLKMQGLRFLSVAAMGAVAGFLVSLFPVVATSASSDPLTLSNRLAIMGSIVALSTLSAVITARVFASNP